MTRAWDTCGSLLTHDLQRTYTAFIPAFTCLDALPYPDFFLGQFFVELRVAAIFFEIRFDLLS